MYATLFDRSYLLRGLTMIDSLLAVAPESEVSVLALDWETAEFLRRDERSNSLRIVTLDEISGPELWEARSTRSYRDFCWTLGSVLCSHLLEHHNEVVYLDADVLFLNDPTPLLEESRRGQIAAVPHDFPQRLKHLEENGIFNVQWVFFTGQDGFAASSRWRDQCLARCELAPEEGVVGDQKYLDDWPQAYPTFVALSNPGAGVGPWNHEERRPQLVNGEWQVTDGKPMIFFHFHELRIESSGLVSMSSDKYREIAPLPEELYQEYLRRLAVNWDSVRFLVPEPDPSQWHTRRLESRLSRWLERLQAGLRSRQSRPI